MTEARPIVLFVCVHNAGRSQMAAAFLRQIGEGRVEVRSAGTMPSDEVHPEVIEAMREAGVDLTGERPRKLADEQVRQADIVITMGCGDACPVYPGKRYEDWQVPDPSGRSLQEVRRIRDDISARVEGLLRSVEAA